MANVTAHIPLDNYVQSGDQTLSELLTSIAAVNSGVRPGIAQQVRDPSTGKLVKVELTFPEAASVQAIDAINANPGVPVAVGSCVDQQALLELNDSSPDGIVFSQLLAGSGITEPHEILATAENGFRLGRLRPASTGNANVYLDLTDLASAQNLLIQITNRNSTETFTVATTDTLTFNLTATLSVTISLTADIVVLPNTAGPGQGTIKEFYVAVDGRIYLRRERLPGQAFGPPVTYDEACLAGPA